MHDIIPEPPTGKQGLKRINEIVHLIYPWFALAAIVVSIAATLHNSTRTLVSLFSSLPSTHGPFYIGRPPDPSFWLSVAGFIVFLLAFLAGFYVVVRFLWKLLSKSPSINVLWLTAKNAIVQAYEAKRFDDLAYLQAGMRAAFVVFVVGAALASLLQRHQAPAHSHQLVVFANNLHILLSAGYCIVMGLQFLSLRHELRKIEEQQQRAEGFGFDREIGQAFWRSTQWDLWYVTLVWMTTVLPNRPFHLGYILPMMGTWLFFGKHAEKVFNTLLIGLFGRFLLVSVLLSLAPGFHTAVGYSDNETLVLLWNLAAAFAFWLSVSLVLTILRHLRFKAKDTARGLAEALRAAEEERLQALQAENKATQAHERESMLRKALETLATRQDQAVFAKDIQRRFIFANEVLLKRLSSLAAKNSWQLENGQVKWEDVFLKTDHDIGIDCDDYRESDGLILNGTRDHFEGFEQGFEKGTAIWTCKDPIVEGDQIVGVVGYVVPKMPLDMQKLTNLVVSSLPFYASIKDYEGHIIWANDRLLEKLGPQLDFLLHKDGVLNYQELSPQAKLKALRGGRGPTDKDLYGPEGEKYGARDSEIMKHATLHEGTELQFNGVTEDLIRRWYPVPERHGRYPDKGWMEFHYFPKAEHGVWVEVWKMPWWGESFHHGKQLRTVKGILVFFIDHHKDYLRQSVIRRWIDLHLKGANEANARLIASALSEGASDEQFDRLIKFRLSRLLTRTLRWFNAFIDEQPNAFGLARYARTSDDLRVLLQVIEEQFANRVTVRFTAPTEKVIFERCGDDLFVIVVALVMNAVEATLERKEDPLPPVSVRLRVQDGMIVVVVSDEAKLLKVTDISEINRLERLNKDGLPAGGFFLAKRLAEHLFILCASKGKLRHEDLLTITPKSTPQGTEVVLCLPTACFNSDDSRAIS